MYLVHCSGHSAAKLAQPQASHSAFGYHQRRIIRDELRRSVAAHMHLPGMLSKFLEAIVGAKSLVIAKISSWRVMRKSGGLAGQLPRWMGYN